MENPRTLVPVSVDTYRKPYLAADGWRSLADLVRDSCQAPLFIWRACNAPGQHLATPTQDAVAGVGTMLDPVLVQQDRTAQRARLHPTTPVPDVSRPAPWLPRHQGAHASQPDLPHALEANHDELRPRCLESPSPGRWPSCVLRAGPRPPPADPGCTGAQACRRRPRGHTRLAERTSTPRAPEGWP